MRETRFSKEVVFISVSFFIYITKIIIFRDSGGSVAQAGQPRIPVSGGWGYLVTLFFLVALVLHPYTFATYG
jgi:hypothetical protein